MDIEEKQDPKAPLLSQSESSIPTEKPERKTPVSFFKIQYSFLKGKDYILLIIGSLSSISLGVCTPLSFIFFGDSINAFINPEDIVSRINQMIMKILCIGAASFVFGLINYIIWCYLGTKTAQEMKKQYFSLLLDQEVAYYDMKKTFDFSTVYQTEMKTIENSLGEKIGNLFFTFTNMLTGYGIGIYYSWKLTLVIISVFPILAVIAFFGVRRGAQHDKKAIEYFGEAGGIAEEILLHIKTVFSYENYEWERERFNDKLNISYKRGVKSGIMFSLVISTLMSIIFSTFSLAFWFGNLIIQNEEINPRTGKVYEAGDIIVVFMCVIMSSMQLIGVGSILGGIAAACGAAINFFELKKRVPEIYRPENPLLPEKSTIKGKIEFRNVSFRYPSKKDQLILNNLNLTINAGENVAIVGESGSGKSTIVNLLERLYELDNGEILLDGIDIREINLNYLRSLFGYVSQEPVLFNESIRENIVFGRANITDEMINEALEKAYALDFVMEKGLDYNVGTKGGKLSGGQKQRIAIARAILTKPKILLLDEATSALDNKSEKEVKKALEKVSENITTIIIAHRLSTIVNSTKIAVLDKKEGEEGTHIVEEGTHQELLDLKGVYAGLIKNQLGIVDEIEREESVSQEMSKSQGDIFIGFEEGIGKNKEDLEKDKDDKEEDEMKKQEKEKAEKEKKSNEYIKGSTSKLLKIVSSSFKCILILGIFFSIFSGFVQPGYGYLMSEGITSLNKGKGNVVAIYYVGLAFGSGLILFTQVILFRIMGEKLAKELRRRTFDKYLQLDPSFYDIEENSPGALMSRLSSDTTNLNGIALSAFCSSAQSVTTVVLGVVLGLIYDWRLSLICFAFVPIYILTQTFIMKIQISFYRINENVNTQTGTLISEAVNNNITIYAYNYQYPLKNKQNRIIQNGFDKMKNKIIINGFLFGVASAMSLIIYAVLFKVGSLFMAKGDDYDHMFKAIFIILFAANGLGMAQGYVGDLTRARQSLVSIFKVLDKETTIVRPNANIYDDNNPQLFPPPNEIKGEIEFNEVTFAYPSKPDYIVLNKVSFHINIGESVAFVGTSGSGKSTIIQLIERFYDINSGSILIDGVDIKKYSLASLRKSIGLVLQEPVIFLRNVTENIRYGKLEASDEEVYQAAKNAKIEKYVNEENFDKEKVSGGEKQRIAIARAMIKNPKILLLDEATSALDKVTEDEVQEHLNECMVGRTSILIAHRLTTVEKCDRIYVIEKGEIIEFGNHEELMQKKGKYFKLYTLGQGK